MGCNMSQQLGPESYLLLLVRRSLGRPAVLAICTKAAAQNSTCATFAGLVKAIAPWIRREVAHLLSDQVSLPAPHGCCVLPGKKYNPGPETQQRLTRELRRKSRAARRLPSSRAGTCVQLDSTQKWAAWWCRVEDR